MKNQEEFASEKISKAVVKKFRPTVNVGVNIDSYGPMESSSSKSWRKEEANRMKSEISALEAELEKFNPEEAAKKVKTALEIKLKLLKLRHQEHELKINNSGIF